MTAPYRTIAMPEAGTPEWHELRRTTGVGASEVAAVMGFSAYDSPLDVYMLKRGLTAPTESSAIMRRGVHMEPFILAEFQQESDIQFSKPTEMFVSLEHPWLFANLDGYNAELNIIAEIKNSDATQNWGETGSQDVPEYYYLQCQVQMLVTGAKECYLVVMLPHAKLRYYVITPNKKIQDQIIEATNTFWNHHVAKGIPPEGDASPESVKKLYPAVTDKKEVSLPPATTLTLIQRHFDLNQSIKEQTAELDKVKAQLMMAMGDAQRAKVEGWDGSMTRSETQATTFTVTKSGGVTFKINHPKRKG